MMFFGIILQLFLGAFYALFLEWSLHIFVHRVGKKRGQLFSFHFHQHHKNSRKHQFLDPQYAQNPLRLGAASKELMALAALSIPHLLLLSVVPFFVVATVVFAARYYYYHRKCHLDVEWCKQHMPWHYDHHMAPNQHANWGVTTDFFDKIFGTREYYLGTEKERLHRERRAAKGRAIS